MESYHTKAISPCLWVCISIAFISGWICSLNWLSEKAMWLEIPSAVATPLKSPQFCRNSTKKLRRDRYKSPLPPCALARFGSIHFRHKSGVHRFAIAGKGKILATATAQEVRLWDLRSGQLRKTISDKGEFVKALAISPNHKWLAIAYHTSSVLQREAPRIRLYHLPSGKPAGRLQSKWAVANSMVFSPDSKILYTDAPNVRAWAIPSGKLLRRIKKGQYLQNIALSPNGKWLAAISNYPLVHTYPRKGVRGTHFLPTKYNLWDLTRGTHTLISSPILRARKLGFTPDNRHVWIQGGKGIGLQQLNTRQPSSHAMLAALLKSAKSLAFARDGKTLAFTTQDRKIKVVSLATKAQIAQFQMQKHLQAPSISFVPKSKLLVSHGAGQTLRFWNWKTKKAHIARHGHLAGIKSIAFSKHGKYILTTGRDQSIRQWEVNTGRQLRSIPMQESDKLRAGFRQDGSIWAVEAGHFNVKFWHIKKTKKRWFTHKMSATAIAVTPDGTKAAVGTGSGKLLVLDLQKKQVHTIPSKSKQPITRLLFSSLPHQQTLMVRRGYYRGSLEIVNLRTKATRQPKSTNFYRHQPFLHSPKGTYSVTAEKLGGKYISIQSQQSGKVLLRLPVPPLYSLAISPDETRFATGHQGQVIVWSLKKKRPIITFKGHDAEVTALAFSPSGKQLISGSSDGTALLWRVHK